MKVTRQAHVLLYVPIKGGGLTQHGGFAQARPLLATELVDALNRLVPTLPPDARVEPSLHDPRWGPVPHTDPRAIGGALLFSWEEELPAAAEGGPGA